jgi:hypothetical protein
MIKNSAPTKKFKVNLLEALISSQNKKTEKEKMKKE